MRKLSAMALLVFAAASGACEPAQPAAPTFAQDVGPIFAAHCTRCHGAGGTLHGDPANYPLGKPPDGYNPGLPSFCHLETFEDIPAGCSTADGGAPADCAFGARTCKELVGGYLPAGMPPPPGAPLNDWEVAVVRAWIKNPLP